MGWNTTGSSFLCCVCSTGCTASCASERQQIIDNNIVFIEIDYLHETPSTIRVLPPYLFRGAVSPEYAPHPYHLLVIDLRTRVSTS